MPALDVPDEQIIDTNGAGDIFHSAYIYAYLTNPSGTWEDHFHFARAAAAHAFQHLGNEASLPTLADIDAAQVLFDERRETPAPQLTPNSQGERAISATRSAVPQSAAGAVDFQLEKPAATLASSPLRNAGAITPAGRRCAGNRSPPRLPRKLNSPTSVCSSRARSNHPRIGYQLPVHPPVTLIWRATAGRLWRRSMMKSCPLGLRAIASRIAASSVSSLSDWRSGVRRSAASSCPRHI